MFYVIRGVLAAVFGTGAVKAFEEVPVLGFVIGIISLALAIWVGVDLCVRFDIVSPSPRGTLSIYHQNCGRSC